MRRLGPVLLLSIICLAVAGCDGLARSRPFKNASELYGVYRLSSQSQAFLRDEKGYPSTRDSLIELSADSILIRRMPDCLIDGSGEPHGQMLSGEGTWEYVPDYWGGDYIEPTVPPGSELTSPPAAGFAGLGRFWVVSSNGRPAIRLNIGDPDSWESVTYEMME